MKPDLAEDIISVSDFRRKTSAYLEEIRSKKRLMVLTQNGHSAAVVLSPAVYEQVQQERDLFAAIARGEREIETGRGVPHERVFKNLFKRLKKT
ncbi:MAG: type II toxin-antitoxin system Phd/YefM family antitoxin [Deltaproteobacteria bacterium]|nr:type II toxin-antitoxin system Phd/YefM family antitoxin [Deltaproteobacteria bacterium]